MLREPPDADRPAVVETVGVFETHAFSKGRLDEEEFVMPFPPIPFLLGAAVGAVVTYPVTGRRTGGSGEAVDAPPESASGAEETSGPAGIKPAQRPGETGQPETGL
jgi:hypothetical protein